MIPPGDVILFTRLTLRQALRAEGLRGLFGWLGHWITALCSWTTEGGYDGFWEYVHVGIVVQDQHGGLRLLEFTSKVDGMARKYIADNGYAKYFGHSLGHGIGLETHEAPSISARNDGILVPGEVFTVEPAVYLPGKFGVRLEDMVLVTKKGCEVLSGSINK